VHNPLVSIIINNFNYGRFLKVAIDSAINQTYKNVEIIVVDDGSTDDSREIIEGYGDKVIHLYKNNGGQASAFNEGYKFCKGEIIIFLDSDDVLLPMCIERAVPIFSENDVVKVHWPLLKINTDGEENGEQLPDSSLAEGNLKESVIANGPTGCGGPPHSPPTSGNAWSRFFIDQIFPMPEAEFRQTADYYLMVLVPVYGNIQKVDEPLGLYRVHGNNSTLRPTYLSDFLERYEFCCKELSEHLLKVSGVMIDPQSWPRKHWYHLVNQAISSIMKIVPEGQSFILVDGNDLQTEDFVETRKRIRFIEREGEYWGAPSNDIEAINEIRNQVMKGATSIIFTWTNFWQLEHYKGMAEYLNERHKCILDSNEIIAFSLT
jgi:glycosyltransferase involved in cell wall biosynthesis